MEAPEPAILDRFRGLVARWFGLQFDDTRQQILWDVLRQRAQQRGCASPVIYLDAIDSAVGEREELRLLAGRLTVSETYFFRDANQFRALTETALPERIRARASTRRLRLLSAGCASGEEPYSMAVALREHFPDLRSWDIEIVGIDLNPAMIALARKARFRKWSLRGTPDRFRDRYFLVEAPDYVLEERTRSMVRFEERNLAGSGLPGLDAFDVVFCRNVIMYLTPDAVQSAIAALTRALLPGGFLFLGSAETMRGLSQDFQLRHSQEAFYYEKRHAAGQPPEGFAAGDTWVRTIRNASERVGSLVRDQSLAEPQPEVAGRTAVGVDAALELLRQERFREALDALGDGPAGAARNSDFQLLRAGLLANCGDLEVAESICGQILSYDDLNAGAHYLTALCRERAGDAQGAMEHDRTAIYLDDRFAMPHLHLGRMARRAADLVTARRELEHAAMLLTREDPLRILLFGGGFARETLLDCSRAELNACGGRSSET